MALWAILLAAAVVAWLTLGVVIALVLLLAALILPWRRRTPVPSLAYIKKKHMQSES
jgi:hypothetical protein